MAINKIQYGNTVLIDLTSDTVTADKLMQGYTAHDRTGALITGTATGGGSGGNVWQDAQGYVHLDDEGTTPITVEPLSVTQNGTYTATTGHAYSPVTVSVSGGGGGGLVYETGTWAPSEDIARGEILFTNTHTEAPSVIILADIGNDASQLANDSAEVFIYGDVYKLFGAGVPYGNTGSYWRYSFLEYVRAYNNASAINIQTGSTSRNSNDTGDTGTSYPRYFAKEDRFYPYSYNASYYFRAGRTYKWIAVWAPTT